MYRLKSVKKEMKRQKKWATEMLVVACHARKIRLYNVFFLFFYFLFNCIPLLKWCFRFSVYLLLKFLLCTKSVLTIISDNIRIRFSGIIMILCSFAISFSRLKKQQTDVCVLVAFDSSFNANRRPNTTKWDREIRTTAKHDKCWPYLTLQSNNKQ